jgi:hypothetical protein
MSDEWAWEQRQRQIYGIGLCWLNPTRPNHDFFYRQVYTIVVVIINKLRKFTI